MVAEPVIEEVAEQVTDDISQIDDTASLEPETASTETDVVDGEQGDSSETVPETEAETEITLDDPRLAAALKQRLEVERNAAAQAAVAKARKEMGSDAAAKARLATYVQHAQQHGSDPERLNLIIQDVGLNKYDEATRTLGAQALEFIGATPGQIERYQAKLESLAGNDLGTFASELFLDATEAIKSSAVTSLTLADIPDDAPLRAEITAEVRRLRDEELKAQKIAERGDRDPAPTVPSGSGGAQTQTDQFRATGDLSVDVAALRKLGINV